MTISKNNWFELFLFKGSKFLIWVMFFCLIVATVLGYFIPGFLIELSENYDKTANYHDTLKIFGILYLGIYANRVIYQLAINFYIKDLIDFVRTKVYTTWILNYDVQTKEKVTEYPQGEVIARIMSDTQALRELVTSGAFGIIIDFCFVLSFMVKFITMNTVSGGFLALSEAIAAILLIRGGKYMREVFNRVRHSKGMVSRTVANVTGGLKEAYFIDHQGYASKTGTASFDDFLEKQLKANVWDASYYSLAESLYPCLLALVVFIFPYSHISQAAVILALVELIQRSIMPIKSIAGKITNIQRAATGVGRITEFVGHLQGGFSSHLVSQGKNYFLKELKVKITSFNYPKREKKESGAEEVVEFGLQDISFSGLPGDLIGIVGLSGSGKSTVLNIIAGNIFPNEGDVTFVENEKGSEFSIPGKEIDDIIKYREQVGIVSQDSHIFSEALKFNICMEENVPERFYQFWDWIKTQIPYLEKWGIAPDDEISPHLLSVGQNQLISAIRSCYLKKPVVLFDEISSALDSDLEEALREVILLIQKNSLTIIVAHRIETIKHAEKIIVLDEGRIVDEGKHDGLLKESEKYQEFVKQLSD